MAKKGMEIVKCENDCDNMASYRIKEEDGEEKMLCTTCQEAYRGGQEHPAAVIEPLGQEEGIDEDIFEEEGEPSEDDDQAGDEDE